MADLGKAFVQIMPSAKGISGSISKIIKPEAEAAGKNAGKTLATNISKSMGSLGKTLTKSITVPVAGAATAASAFLLKGGWDRLVGLDSARAQLEGLGYDFEAVERISNLVNESIQGTVMTMADGVGIAAGALAAGVKEGAELERFIGLVGSAAVGSGREVSDMAMIFNRVQGMGKLMTMELNMIEDGMPGFSQAMAKHFGIGQAEFRDMVTAGEVSSEDFLNVMDDFAGGMSDAYSKSWAGIFSRVRSNLAILGEYMLEGMFPDAKEALADFLATIREDDIRNWARGIGDTIGEAFRNMIQTIKDVINWWGNLSDGTKRAIQTVGTIVVVMGPVLSVLSKLVPVITTTVGVVKAVSGALTGGATAFGALKAGMLAIMGPAGWVVALIAGIVAAGIALYMNWDTIKEKASELGQWISEKWTEIKTAITEAVTNIWNSITEWFGGLPAWFNATWNAVIESIALWITNMITKAVEVGTKFLETISTFFSELPYNIGFFLGTAIATVAQWTIDMLSKARETGSNFINSIVTWFQQLPGRIQTWLSNAINHVTSWVSNMGVKAQDAGSRFITNLISFFQQLPGQIQTWLTNTISRATEFVIDMGTKAREAGQSFIQHITTTLSRLPGQMVSIGKNIVTGLWNGIKSMWDNMTGWVGDLATGFINGIKGVFGVRSPSRVFRDEVGKWIPAGLAKGIEDNISPVTDAMQRLTDLTTGSIETEVAMNAAMSGTSGAYSPSTTATYDDRLYSVMRQLLEKDFNVYIDGRLASIAMAPAMSQELDKNNNISARRRGVVRP